MQVLVPTNRGDGWRESLLLISGQKPLRPFQNITKQFIQEISIKILRNISFRSYPELVAMAHWMRKAHIFEMEEQFKVKKNTRTWVPRGTVVHFAPSNVDSIFIYSWFISLLMGNINIIRLSQKRSEQITMLLEVIDEVIRIDEYKAIYQRTLIVTYDHNEEFTNELSMNCNMRVIWGGDETVNRIRSVPLPPYAIEIVFSDRFSLSCINAKRLIVLDEEGLQKLAVQFYNDAYWFDQMACSSPRMVVWIGEDNDVSKAKHRFWSILSAVIDEKRYITEPSVSITRMVTGYSYAAEGIVDKLSSGGTQQPYRGHFLAKHSEDQQLRGLHCGGGFFLETELLELTDLVDLVERKDQTLSVYGFTADQLVDLANELNGSGIDRIVPIGEALTFNNVWDGYDLMLYFTKEISIVF